MNEIRELTKAEEQIMQVLWDTDGCFVKDIIPHLPDPKPAYNTVSTVVRILETKGFVDHESFGKTHRYFPKIKKEEYKKLITGKLLNNYFDNSAKSMLSFFLEEKKLDIKELNELMKLINAHK